MVRIALALVAVIALAGCGRKEAAPRSASSVVAADINAPSPLDSPYRLKGGEEFDVDRLFALLPLYMRPAYAKASFDSKLGAMVVSDLEFGGVGAERRFRAKRAEFYGVDLDRLEKLLAASGAPLDAPLEPVLGKLRLYDVESGEDDGAAMSIGAVEIDSLRLRPGGLPEETNASGLAVLFNAFDVAGVYFRNIQTSGRGGTASEAGAAFDFAAEDLRIVGVGGGEMKALIARKLDYFLRQSPESLAAATRGLGPGADILVRGPLRNFIAPENQRTTVKSLEWRDVSFAGLMEWGLKGERPPTTAHDLIDLGTARLVDVETFIGDRRLSIVPTTDVSAMQFTWLAPSKLRAVTRGGLYDFTAYVSSDNPKAIAELKSRKLDRVRGDSDFAFDWNAGRGDAALSTGFDSTGFADFDLDLALEGLELSKIEAGRAAGAATPALDLARLKSFSLTVADEQFLNAFYALSALETGGSAADIRAAAPAALRLGASELRREGPRLAGFINAFADFLEKGGTLEIRAAPETPVPLHAMRAAAEGGPDAMADAINLTVTRTK